MMEQQHLAISQHPDTHRRSFRRRGEGDKSRTTSSKIESSASPEVITSLITSLAVDAAKTDGTSQYTKPASTKPRQVASLPTSPAERTGSFGVDYGAYSFPAEAAAHGHNLDDLAATAPVIKTSKPPSGFSPLTAGKAPSKRDSSGGLKSLLSGRSSLSLVSGAKGSEASRDADNHSIGNLSIEPGSPPPAVDLRRRRSHDSWGKKSGRSSLGLMYMPSKERLRDNEERKRGSLTASGSVAASRRGSLNRATSPRPDPFLAETSITEEPSPTAEEVAAGNKLMEVQQDYPGSPRRPIPERDSSLYRTGAHAKRSSRRSSKRDSQIDSGMAVSDSDGGKSRSPHKYGDSPSKRPQNAAIQEEAGQGKQVAELQQSEMTRSNSFRYSTISYSKGLERYLTDLEYDPEEGAPSPSIAQSRKRDREMDGDKASRRRSGYGTDHLDSLKTGKGDARYKRASGVPGPLSPRFDDRGYASSQNTGQDGADQPPHVAYERPLSADSIDDAVESYLCSPRLSQKIKHPQTGRVISFSEVGDSEGSAVFCCVGMGLTRYITAFYDELALTLKLRLITPDRPGVGDSEPYADGTATPLSWPDDVYAICQALKITKFSILAHSAGAIYALATALRMPQHIRGRIHLLAPWIPPSQMSVFGASAQTPPPPTNPIPTSQRILRALPTPILRAANSNFMAATSSSLTSSLPKTQKRNRKAANGGNTSKDMPTLVTQAVDNKENLGSSDTAKQAPVSLPKDMRASGDMDRAMPDGPVTPSAATDPQWKATGSNNGHRKGNSGASHYDETATNAMADKERQAIYDTRLTHAIWDLATTGANPAVDLLVCLERHHTIGFRYVDITRPIVMHHGSRDTRVPVENVKWLGKTMRRCEVRVLEGEGHGLMASATVMGSVLMEISKEWEDWMRVTGADGRPRGRNERRVSTRT